MHYQGTELFNFTWDGLAYSSFNMNHAFSKEWDNLLIMNMHVPAFQLHVKHVIFVEN